MKMTFPRAIQAASTLGLALSALAQGATLLENNGFLESNIALPGHPDYGSNIIADDVNWSTTTGLWGVIGTPGIALSWDGGGGGNAGTGLDTYTNWDGRGGVIQLDATRGGTNQFAVTFTPMPTVGVHISSFDLDKWAGPDMAVDWEITDLDHNVLASGDWTRTTNGRDTITPSYSGEIGQALILRFNLLEGAGDSLAMDNLSFDQIPEPSSPLLATLALAICLRRRR